MIKNTSKFVIIFIALLCLLPQSVKSFGSFTKIAQNPIVNIGPTTWDSSRSYLPSAIQTSNGYNLYFTGYDGSRFKIGLADSIDSINWSKYLNNPVIDRVNSLNKDSHDPTVIQENNGYTMWYTTSDNGGSTNFAIQKATSTDGNNWLDSLSTPVFRPQTGWGSNGVSAPFVLKVGSEYKMWMTSSQTGHWSIGYATSSGGINWTPYADNPIIVGNQSWEGTELGGPSVIFDGTTYHMWYSSNSASPSNPSYINYATSTDGITWTKPAAGNPVLTKGSSGSFDSSMIGDPSVIQAVGTTYLFYSALGPYNGQTAWRIGLATDAPIATPSATPTPTPTPIPVSKVVVVPGFGASWNPDAILNCKMQGYSGGWSLASYAQKIYSPLLTSLSNAGYTTTPLYYDWRQQATTSALSLQSLIDGQVSSLEKVDVVAHSMGGIVTRAYIDQVQQNNKIHKLLTAGTPHFGSAYAYPAWSGGIIWDDNFIQKVATDLLLKRCGGLFSNKRLVIQRFFPSVENLLPIYDFLRDPNTKLLKPIASLFAQNTWLMSHPFSPPFFGVNVETLAGTGKSTLQYIKTKTPSSSDISQGNWLDGKADKKETTSQGDGTVLTSSSQLSSGNGTNGGANGAVNIVLNKNHSELVSSQDGINAILSFLGPSVGALGPKTPVPVFTEPTSALIVITYPAHATLQDSNKNTFTDTDGLLSVINPKTGLYPITITPSSNTTLVIVSQYLQNGSTAWKEYTFTGTAPFSKIVKFDASSPVNDPLK